MLENFEIEENKILVLYVECLNNNNNKIINFSFAKSDFRLVKLSLILVDRKLQEQSKSELLNCIKSIYIKKDTKLLLRLMHLEMYIRNY